MLALSASELATCEPANSDLTCTAMTHRVKAITSLNNAISSGITSFEQGNAMLATCYSLLFQSTLINDGLVEYMTFIRGCVVVGMQMGTKNMKFVFHHMWGDESVELIDPGLKLTPLVDSKSVGAACRSIEKFRHLCHKKCEVDVYALLLNMARALFTSSRDGELVLFSMR
jgi:hypothetical protein